MRGAPLASELPRQVAVQTAREGKDEGDDVRADMVAVDHAELGHHHGVRDDTRHSLEVARALRGANAQRWMRQVPAADAKNVGDERRHGQDTVMLRSRRVDAPKTADGTGAA